MKRRTWSAIITGVILLGLGVVLRKFANQEGMQLILSIPTFIVVGFIATGLRRGFLIAFLLTLVFVSITMIVSSPEGLSEAAGNASVLAAMAVVNFLIPALLAGILGAIGSLAGRLVFKK